MKSKSSSQEVGFRDQIIQQATQLFKIFGYNKLIMEDIARAVGKRRTTIYIYFKDKDAIFTAVIEKELEEYFQSLNDEIPRYPSGREKLLHFLRLKFDFRNKKATEYLSLTKEMGKQPEILSRMRSFSDSQELKQLETIIQAGIANEEFEAISDDQRLMTCRIIISAMDGISNEVTANLDTTDLDATFEVTSKLLIKSLAI